MGLFSSECSHCGSTEHASKDCPHGFFSSKCSHCGSTEHASKDCPHGIFSSECSRCGSTEHASKDCPHGIFSSKKKDKKQIELPKSKEGLIGMFIGFAILLTIALFILTIAFFLSPIILLIWYIIKKRETQWLAIVGMLISLYLVYDILNNGAISHSLIKTATGSELKYIAIGYFVLFVTTLGFFLDKYIAQNVPVNENGNFFTQKNITERRPYIMGLSGLLLAIFLVFQWVFNTPGSIEPNAQYNNYTEEEYIHSDSEEEMAPEEEYYDMETEGYATVINNLLMAEDNRNFSEIQNYYSYPIERYWEVYNIGKEDLKKQYDNIWKKTYYGKNTLNDVVKIDDNTYDLLNTYEFHLIKKDEIKTVNSRVRFVFNENQKIIQVYGIE